VIRYADLAQVMDHAGEPDPLLAHRIQTQFLGDHRGVTGDRLRMSAGRNVAQVQGLAEQYHGVDVARCLTWHRRTFSGAVLDLGTVGDDLIPSTMLGVINGSVGGL
jgi:hypothetical protein